MTEQEVISEISTRKVVPCTHPGCKKLTTTSRTGKPLKCATCGTVGPTCQDHAFIECLCDYEPGSNSGDWLCKGCGDKHKGECELYY